VHQVGKKKDYYYNFRFVRLDMSGDSAGTNKKFRINGLGSPC